jgi:hypothetical protein
MFARIRIDATLAVLISVALAQVDAVWAGFAGGAALTGLTVLRWRPKGCIPTQKTFIIFTVGPIVLTVLAGIFLREALQHTENVLLWGAFALAFLAAVGVTSRLAVHARYEPV